MAVLAVMLLLSACGSGMDGWMDGEEALNERILAEYDSYDWPESVEMDPQRILLEPSPEENQYQPGFEHTILRIANECAWFQSWLDADEADRPDITADIQRVLQEHLEARGSTGGNLESEQDFVQRMTQATELGDGTPLQNYITANCGRVL